MNITLEDKGNLTKLLKIEVQPEDYKESVTKQLKDYQKKAQEPGFRVGKVPFGIINKKYGRAVRLEEVNKLITDKLNAYLTDNKIPVLGQPIPNEENAPKGDFAKDDTFEFFFDLGLSPEINLDLKEKEFAFNKITVDEKQVDEYVKNILNQHGEQKSIDDEVKAGDIVKGKIMEMDADGNQKADGIVNAEATLGVDYIKDEDTKKLFLGAKKEDVIAFDPKKAAGDNDTELAYMLGIEKEAATAIGDTFNFVIEDVTRLEPAQIDEELYKKVYPAEEITTEEAFRAKVKEDSEKAYERESQRFLMAEASDKLVEETEMELPDAFLKRWLVQNEENITAEMLENDYDKYARSMKWQMIENKLIKDFEIEVKEEEVKAMFRTYFMQQMGGAEISEEMKQQLDPIVDSMMQNQEQVKQVYEQLFDEKLSRVIKDNSKLKVNEVSYDEFIKLAQARQAQSQENHVQPEEEK